MPLFQDFGKRFADAAKLVGKRTQDATEVVRLSGRQSALQDEIERMFNQIGKAYYALRNAGGESGAADALCAKVDALRAELESVKAELDRIRNLKRCPNCGEVQAQGAAYCASCGTKMPEVQAEPEREERPAEEPPSEMARQPEVEINWPKPPSGQAPEPVEPPKQEPSEQEPPEQEPSEPEPSEPEPSEPEPSAQAPEEHGQDENDAE